VLFFRDVPGTSRNPDQSQRYSDGGDWQLQEHRWWEEGDVEDTGSPPFSDI